MNTVFNSARLVRARGRVLAVLAALVTIAVAPTGAQSQSPDFTLSVSPSSATVQPGASEFFHLTVTSIDGLRGTINVGLFGSSSVSPRVTNGPAFHFSRYDVPVSPTAPTGGVLITATTSTATPAGTYTITVTGKDITGGAQYGLTHTTTFTLTVA